jgi:hypothetical protein
MMEPDVNRLITRPRMVLPLPVTFSAVAMLFAPSSRI